MFNNAQTLTTLTLFVTVLVMSDQAWLSMKPRSLLKFFYSGVFQLLPLQDGPCILMFYALLRFHWTDTMTHADTMFCHCWFLEFMCTYVSLVLFAPHLDSPSPLSYIHFLHSHGLWYTSRTSSSNPHLADLSHLRGFPFLVCEYLSYYVLPEFYWFYCWRCDKTVSWLYL
jgi:hypothetical protein